MTYHVYENWRAEGHKARIHFSDCPSCNYGKGVHSNAGYTNGKWHGPFQTFQQALQVAQSTGGIVSRCKRCTPH